MKAKLLVNYISVETDNILYKIDSIYDISNIDKDLIYCWGNNGKKICLLLKDVEILNG